MLKITDLTGRALKWVQPHAMKMEYQLLADDALAATLDFRSAWGSFASAASADGVWTFKRVGFWQTRVTVRADGGSSDLAVFRNATWSGGGTLEMADGRKYPANTNFWSTLYQFTTDAGEPVISFRKIGGMLHMSSEVEIHPIASTLSEARWMVLLGWYLTVMMYMDSASASAVVAVTV